MMRYVIEPEVALALAERAADVPAQHQLLAPTLMRSQVLSQLFVEIQRGELTRKEADHRLDYLRKLRIRLLGDRVMQRVAWDIAADLGWRDTFVAEYVALTKLQGDKLVTMSPTLGRTVSQVIGVATMDDLLR